MDWTDVLGVVAVLALCAGTWMVAGPGWSLIVAGVVLVVLWLMLEVAG